MMKNDEQCLPSGGDGGPNGGQSSSASQYLFDEDMHFDDEPVDYSPIAVKYRETKDSFDTEHDHVLLSEFAKVVSIDPENATWCYKALRRIVKIYNGQGEYEKMMDAYRKMLEYIKWGNKGASVDRLLHFFCVYGNLNSKGLQELYQITVEALEKHKKQYLTLWFTTSLQLCNILFDNGQYTPISRMLMELHKYCQKVDGTIDEDKSRELLKVYAIEFQLYTETDDNRNQKMQEIYQKAFSIKRKIYDHIDHKLIGILHECGGKMYMAERQWTEASVAFRAAFRNYCKENNQRYIQCLKYDLLASMMGSKLAPFDTEISEGKWSEFGLALSYCENNLEILAMKASIEAYQKQEFAEFERVLKSNLETIMSDTFIRSCMDDMLEKMRTQAILNLLELYATKIEISFISTKLGVTEDEAMELLRLLILNNGVDWLVDEVEGYLVRGDYKSV